MSVALMTLAWKVPFQSSKKLAMLAMCDWADDDGGSLYPGIAKLAERLTCSTRQAQRILHSLIADGWIAVVANEHGGAPGSTRHYMINVSKLEAAAKTSDTDYASKDPSINARARTNKSSTAQDQKRSTSATQPSTTTECPPDVDPQVYADWLQVRKAKRAGPVTQTVLARLRREAAKAGITMQEAIEYCCLLGWQGFKSEWLRPRGRSHGPRPQERFSEKVYVTEDL